MKPMLTLNSLSDGLQDPVVDAKGISADTPTLGAGIDTLEVSQLFMFIERTRKHLAGNTRSASLGRAAKQLRPALAHNI